MDFRFLTRRYIWSLLVLVACLSNVRQPTTIAQTERIDQRWLVHDVGVGTKPAFDFDATGRLHVMGMTEEINGVVWYAVADSAAGPWSPINVANGYFYGPGDLRVGPDGTAHLAWHDHDDEDPNHLTVTPDGNTQLFRISTPGHNGWDNALALDSSGKLFQSSVNPLQFGAPASLEFGVFDGSTWNYSTVANSDAFMYGLNSSIALDSTDQPHFAYCDCSDWATPGDLKYARPTGDAWEITSVVTGGIRGRFPSAAIDSEDRVHLAWIDIDAGDQSRGFVQYGILQDSTWNVDTVDTLEDIRLGFGGARKLVSLALDGEGVPHLAYGDQGTIKYALRDGGNDNWTRTTVLDSDDNIYNGLVVMRLDESDDPAIVFWQPNDVGTGLVRIASFGGRVGPELQAGDANQDFEFNQLDLFQVLRAGKYLTGQTATWGDGDWDGAPGGQLGSPPAGDGVFGPQDLVAALKANLWLAGPYAVNGFAGEQLNDALPVGQVSVGYDPLTGELWVDASPGSELTSINIESVSGIFVAQPAQNLGGRFDVDSDTNIFKATFGGSFGSISFGNVTEAGLAQGFLLSDLSIEGSLMGGGGIDDVSLVFVPEPSMVGLLIVGLVCGLVCTWRDAGCRN